MKELLVKVRMLRLAILAIFCCKGIVLEGRVFKASVGSTWQPAHVIIPGEPTQFVLNAFANAQGVFLDAMAGDPPNIGAAVHLPFFGDISFAPAGSNPAITSDQQIVRGYDGPKTIMGPVEIDSYQVLLYAGYTVYVDEQPTGNFGTTLGIQGTAKIFGKSAAMGLESISASISRPSLDLYDINVTECTLVFTFPETVGLQIIPGHTGNASRMTLHLVAGAAPTLNIETTLFGNPVTFSGALATGLQPDFSMSTAPMALALTDLIPEMVGTPFESFVVHGTGNFVPASGGGFSGTLSGAVPGSQATIELLPGMQILLNDCSVLYSNIGTVTKMNGTFQGQPLVCWGIQNDQTHDVKVIIDLEHAQLTSLIPQLNCPDLNQVYIDARFAISKQDGIVLCGSTDGTPLTLFGITMQQIQVSLDTGNKKGFIIGRFVALGLPIVGNFSVDWNSNPLVCFTAQLPVLKDIKWRPFAHITADVPGLAQLGQTELSDVQVGVKSQFTASIEGIQTTYTQLKNAYATIFNKRYSKAALDTQESAIEDAVDTLIEDPARQVRPYEGVAVPPPQPVDPDQDKTINDTANENLSVADVKDISAGAVTFEAYLQATGTIFGINASVTALLGLLEGGLGTILAVSFPDGVKLADVFPELFGEHNTVTDAVNLFKYGPTRCVLSTVSQTFDTITVRPGITFASSFGIDPDVVGTSPEVKILLEVLNNFAVATGSDPAGLTMYGSFNPFNPQGCIFKIGLSTGSFGLSIPPLVFNAASVNLAVRGQPTVGLEGTFSVIPEPGELPLVFAAEILAGIIDFGLAFSMQNIWQNPFGLTGISFGNLGIKATQSYEAVIAAFGDAGLSALIPSQLAMTGQASVGTIHPLSGQLTISLGTNIQELALVMQVNNPPTLPNIVAAVLEQRGIDPVVLQPILNFIPLNILSALIYFVPNTIQIGNVTVDQGIGFDMSGQIFGQESRICASLDLNGIVAKGELPKIDFGALYTITDVTGLRGADFDLLLSLTQGIGITADCRVKLLGVFDSLCDVHISTDGMRYHTRTNVGPIDAGVLADFDLGSISFTDPVSFSKLLRPEDLNYSIRFADNFTPMVTQWVNNFLNNTRDTFNNSLNMIIEQVARNTALVDIFEQQAVVAEKWAFYISINPWVRPLDSFLAFLDWAFQGTVLLGLQVKYAVEQTPFGQFARQALEELGLVPIINGALTIFRDAGVLVLNDAQIVFNDLANLAVFRSAVWAGTVKDILEGIIPGIMVELSISGQINTYNLGAFDMKDPINSGISMASRIGTLAQDVLTNALNTVRTFPEERFAEKMKRHPAMAMFKPVWNECRFEIDTNNPYYQYSTFARPNSSRVALPGISSNMVGLPRIPDDEETVNRMKGMVSILETIEKLIQATDFGKYAHRLLGEAEFRQAVVTGILQAANEQGLVSGNYADAESSNKASEQSLQKIIRSGQSAEMKAFIKDITPSTAVLAALKDDAKERARTGVMKVAGEVSLKLFNASNAAHGRVQLKTGEVPA